MNLALVSKAERYGIITTSTFLFLIFMGIAIFSKSCQSDNGFRVEHSARMGGGFDTTKKCRTVDVGKLMLTPPDPIDLRDYSNVKILIKEGAHFFHGEKGQTYAWRFKKDTLVEDPMKLYYQYFDTTKPKAIPQQKIVNRYKLVGTDTMFQILWMQILLPEDVTPRQNKMLQGWLQRGIIPDTTVKN